MKDKTKKMILLTIKDLRDLGVIGKKKRRRRRNKLNKKNVNSAVYNDPNFKSQTFLNTSNLDTENKRLNNELVGSQISIRNNDTNNNNTIINDLQNSHSQLRDATIAGFQHFNNKTRFIDDNGERPRFNNVSSYINFADDTNNNYESINDNFDTPTVGGSDSFIADGTDIPEYDDGMPDLNEIPTDNSVSASYQTPEKIDTTVSFKNTAEEIENKKLQKIQFKENLKKEATDLGVPINELTNNVKSLRLKIKDRETFNGLVIQYQGLGGTDDTFINSNSIKIIKVEIKKLEKDKEKTVKDFIKSNSNSKPTQNKIGAYFNTKSNE